MESTAILSLLLTSLTAYSGGALVIIGYVLGLGTAYLLFKFGWSAIKNSLNGGQVYRDFYGNKLSMPKGYSKRNGESYINGEKIPF